MKVWFNQSFSMRNVIARMVAQRPSVQICVSAKDGHSPVRDVAPTFWIEPESGATDYTQWVLETAVDQGVDVLVAQRGRLGIATALDRFDDRGIRVHVASDAETLDLLDDKAAFARSLHSDPYLCPTTAVSSAADFEAAVQAFEARGVMACVKPSRGVFGAGYWTLDADEAFAHLADPDARRITPEAYAAALRRAEDQGEIISLLVMEHLPGLEASIDIVAEHGTVLLAAVRTKLDANRQRIETRHPLIQHASELVATYRLHGALNVQYKRDRHGTWRILEINSRAAGGASYCDEVGIPFCTTWLDLVTGRAVPFEASIDAEITAVVRAERRPVPRDQNGSAGTSHA